MLSVIRSVVIVLLIAGTAFATVKTVTILHANQVARGETNAQQGVNPSSESQAVQTSSSGTIAPLDPLAQVALHKTPSNCWIVISNKAYNVSSFLNLHPGGASTITPYCGKDSTEAFKTHGKSGGSNHSAYAYSLLPSYYVAPSVSSTGVTGQTTSVKTAAALSIGDRVRTTTTLNVRAAANDALLGKQVSGAFGSVVSGPIVSGGYTWWKINFDTGVDGWVIQNYIQNPTTAKPVVPSVTPLPVAPITPPASSVGTYTSAEVSVHKTSANCWIIISDKIYNVTSFLSQHPGGVSTITPYCGADSTVAFQTHGRNGGTNHTAYAYSLLPTYYVGTLSVVVIPGTFTLSVSKAGTGSGMVSGGAISCGATCSAAITSGTSVTLTATASSGSTFTGWSGACSGTGSCSVTMSASKNVTANFDLIAVTPPPTGTTYTAAQVATHSTQGNCWIIISSKVYNVTNFISAHPGGASTIVSRCGTDSTTVFTTNASGGHAHSAYAFSLLPTYYVGDLTTSTPTVPVTYALTVSKTGTGSGTVSGGAISCGATCSATLDSGTSVVLTATAASGSTFTGWSGSCTGTGSCTVTMSTNKSVTANFNTGTTPPPTTTTYTAAQVATHSTQGNCWIIISSKVYNVTNFISAHPGGASAIVSRCGTDSTTVFTTSGGGGHRHSAYAYSLLPSYYVGDLTTAAPPPVTPGSFTLSVTSGNGTVTSNPSGISCGATCAATFTDGTSVALSATPSSGYTFSGWSGACSGTGTCTVTMSADRSVAASYTASGGGGGVSTTYTVNVTSSGDYDVTDLTLNVGDKITFVYTPPRSGEVKTRFSPSTINSVTLDSENTQRTRTFSTAGTWTFQASNLNGNQGTITVQ